MVVAAKAPRPFSEHARFHAKQKRAFRLMYVRAGVVLLCGGAGFGGKSHFLRASAIHHCLWLASHKCKIPVVFASATYEALRDRHFDAFAREWGHLGRIVTNHRQHGRCFLFWNEDVPPICFRNIGKASERRGSEYAAGFLDETTEITDAMWGDFTYTIRAPGVPEIDGRPHRPIVTATNPDGIGFHWVRALWRPDQTEKARSQKFDPKSKYAELDPADYAFVQFLPDDNPEFDEPTFLRNIAGLPLHVQKARRYGSWERPEGARFPQLDAEVHAFVREDVFPMGIPSHWPIYLGIDYGLRAPFAALWAVVDHDRNVYVYRERYKAGLTADLQAQLIANSTLPSERITSAYLDPAMWQNFPRHDPDLMPRDPELRRQDKSAHRLYADVLGPLPNFGPLVPGWNRSREMNLMMIDRYLNRGNGHPDLFIEEECVELWKELTNAIYPKGTIAKDSSEDIDQSCADHAITALYYLLSTLMRGAKAIAPPPGSPASALDLGKHAQAVAAEREKQAIRQFQKEAKKGFRG